LNHRLVVALASGHWHTWHSTPAGRDKSSLYSVLVTTRPGEEGK